MIVSSNIKIVIKVGIRKREIYAPLAISGRVAIKKEKKEAEARREDGRNGRMRGESMIVDAKNAFWLLSAGRRHNSRGDTIKNATPPGGRKGERERENFRERHRPRGGR